MKTIDYTKFISGEPYNWFFYCNICDRRYTNNLKSSSRFLRVIENHYDTTFHRKNLYKKCMFNDAFNTSELIC